KRSADRHAHRTIDRDPAQHARVEKLALAAADLPDALVGALPVRAHPVDQPAHVAPQVVRDRLTVLVEQIDRVEQLAVDVELELGDRAVADPDRTRAHVAVEMRQLLFREILAAIDTVHDLERAVGLELLATSLYPLHERRGFFGETETHQ